MRTNADMLKLILETAEAMDEVRTVTLHGSRVSGAPEDRWMDYDVAYYVTEMGALQQETAWLAPFGDRLIMQRPELSTLAEPHGLGWFPILMQFADGSRIDLTLVPVKLTENYLQQGEPGRMLLDKDGLLQRLSLQQEPGFAVVLPTAAEYADCCNEFWWVSPYVVKGLARGQLLYALEHISILRKEYRRMLSWKAAAEADGPVYAGKQGDGLEAIVPELEWQMLQRTYARAEPEKIAGLLPALWQAFSTASNETAGLLGFPYRVEDRLQSWLHERLQE
ncbi:aminoglycoside 6-adenylyltransferase [Alkalicoccus luteus]|uniref:Aminoglycoside 6-adenylyltransferase n=1 Tax=Alkalicoccus luteus TaxID=1237094 RepID=A0A969TWZ8_9BACI|nr:aminoglycoside 6-adenylyltransferase [Alkalicoccus luteus]